MQEQWKDVVGYEGRYMVSNLGNIKSTFKYSDNKMNKRLNKLGYREKNIYIGYNTSGYPVVVLRENGKKKFKSIHRLVAEAFIPKKENKNIVNHIDGNKSNNCVDNLEWVTSKENKEHGWKNNLYSAKHRMRSIICIETQEVFEVLPTTRYRVYTNKIVDEITGSVTQASSYFFDNRLPEFLQIKQDPINNCCNQRLNFHLKFFFSVYLLWKDII